MDIHTLEKRWIQLSITLLMAFAVLIGVAAYAFGFQVPRLEQRVRPEDVLNDPKWGKVRELEPGRTYEVYLISRAWQFQPRTIEIPRGAKVTFYVTSVDVQHGFKVMGTSISMQVLPGYVGVISYTFKEPGVYRFICTEYCGLAHAAMFGEIIVK